MGVEEIRTFLFYLNNDRHVAGSTYSQALCALLSLYKEVLGIELPWIEGISRRKRPPKRPTVLTQTQVSLVLDQMRAVKRAVLAAKLTRQASTHTHQACICNASARSRVRLRTEQELLDHSDVFANGTDVIKVEYLNEIKPVGSFFMSTHYVLC
jgi:hypothetical protein